MNFFGGPPAGTTVQLDTNQLHYSGLALRASFHHTPSTVRRAFALLASGCFKADRFLTGRVRLGDVVSLYRSMNDGGVASSADGDASALSQAEVSRRWFSPRLWRWKR